MYNSNTFQPNLGLSLLWIIIMIRLFEIQCDHRLVGIRIVNRNDILRKTL